MFAAWGDDKAIEFLRRLHENAIVVAAGNSDVKDRVSDGRVDVGIMDEDDAVVALRDGKPVALAILDQEGRDALGTPLMPNVALLVSGMLYTRAPFPARTGTSASEVALFGTGFRNSLPVTVQIGGKTAQVTFAGASGMTGLEQINAVIPEGVTGQAAVVVTTAGGAVSRNDVFITVQ